MFKVGGKSKSVGSGRGTVPKPRVTLEDIDEQGVGFESGNGVCRHRRECGDARRSGSTRGSGGVRAAGVRQLGGGASADAGMVVEARVAGAGLAGSDRHLLPILS